MAWTITNRVKIAASLTVLFLAFGVGLSIWLFQVDLPFLSSSKYEIPDASWEKLSFEEINNVTNLSKIPQLRNANLSKNDIEIRIWRGFGLSNLEAIIMKKTGRNWSALHIKGDNYIQIENVDIKNLKSPKSGWDSLFGRISDAGIFIMKDSSQNSCAGSGIDGMSYVVETYREKLYRTYKYNTSYSKCAEARALEKIAEIIAEEFDDGTDTCKNAEWFPCARYWREKLLSKSN